MYARLIGTLYAAAVLACGATASCPAADLDRELPDGLADGLANGLADGLAERGEYLAKAADCVACHTAPAGPPFAGGLAITSPVGVIYSSNITPSIKAGIGTYNEAQFSASLRRGIRGDGANLYPAMPYTSYAVFTDADVHALYVYFMQSVKAVDVTPQRTALSFPLNLRIAMKIWNSLFLRDAGYREDPQQSAQWNRGRYLVQGAAHCGECHTPRGFLMQAKGGLELAGAQVGPWFAPNVTSDPLSGVGDWSGPDLQTYLRTGVLIGKARAAGSMAEAVEHSFQYLTLSDLAAMATYVLSVPAIHDAADSASRISRGHPWSELGALRGANGVRTDRGSPSGAELFEANCASCHEPQGQGTKDGYYPSLFDNSTVGARNPINLIATILNGVNRTTSTQQAYMPGFAGNPNDLAALSNEDVRQLANYLIEHFGAGRGAVTAAQVDEVRRGGPRSPLPTLARAGVVLGALALLMAPMLLLAYRRRRNRPAPLKA